MICKPCADASDAGEEGILSHFARGCKGIWLNSVEEPCIDATQCDCQHRDDLPKRELKASEV